MPALLSLIRLGTKYEISEFHEEALRFVEGFFPDTMEAWDSVTDDPPFTFETADLVSLANLAEEVDLAKILPFALYRCCQLSSKELINGVRHSRGDVATLTPSNLIKTLELQKFEVLNAMNMMANFALIARSHSSTNHCHKTWDELMSTYMLFPQSLAGGRMYRGVAEQWIEKGQQRARATFGSSISFCRSCMELFMLDANEIRETYFILVKGKIPMICQS